METLQQLEEIREQGGNVEFLEIGALDLSDQILELGAELLSADNCWVCLDRLDDHAAEAINIALDNLGDQIDQLVVEVILSSCSVMPQLIK
jgi:hypothetical protein